MTEVTQGQRIAAMYSGDRVNFVLHGKFRSFLNDSAQGQRVLALLKAEEQDIEAIAEASDIATYIAKRSSGRVLIDDKGGLRLDGKLVDFGLAGRILAILDQGFNFDDIARFIERVSLNPDTEVAQHLFRFLEKGNLPINSNGKFYAFKKVDNDYLSYRAGANGKVKYPIGEVVSEDRETCDPNRLNTCSRGLHACSHEYLNVWYRAQGRVLLLEIDPADVVSVPADYNDQKLRACSVYVVGEIPEEEAKTYFQAAVDNRFPSIDWSLRGQHDGAMRAVAFLDDETNDTDPDLGDVPAGEARAYAAEWYEAFEAVIDSVYGWSNYSITLAAAVAGAHQAAEDEVYDNAPVRDHYDLRQDIAKTFFDAAEQEAALALFDSTYAQAYHASRSASITLH